MQSLNDLLITRFVEKNDKSKIVNERQAALEPFVKAMPDMKVARIAMLVAHVKTADLYPFLKDCQRARNFAAYFQWALKKK
jgi:hypothetical protein